MKKIFLAACMLALLAGCSTFRKHEPIPVVNGVDLDRFMGIWYVMGSVPSIFDSAPYNSQITYQRAERGISINYRFNAGDFNGKERSISVRAMVDNPGINSDWSVTFVTWPFESDYKIIHLEPDYSVAVIGQPSLKNVWILSRTKSIDDPVFSDIILYLQSLGYDVGKIRVVPQG